MWGWTGCLGLPDQRGQVAPALDLALLFAHQYFRE